MVCVVIALSNKKLSLVFALYIPYVSVIMLFFQSSTHRFDEVKTYLADSFRYIDDGVRNSEDRVALSGTRFGGFGFDAA